MDALRANPEYEVDHAFWSHLKEGRDLFERERRIPAVKSDWRGVYMFE